MNSSANRLDRLLEEIARDEVVPQRYSYRSMLFRSKGLVATTVMALIAILSGMLLGAAESDQSVLERAGRRAS